MEASPANPDQRTVAHLSFILATAHTAQNLIGTLVLPLHQEEI